jgi:nucleotide-binding universal stress UspA family protein
MEADRMTKAILVGYDPQTRDRAPVEFGLAAARFTGAPLVIASVHDAGGDALAAGQMSEELVADVTETLEEVRGDLHAQGVAVECRELASRSAARALHEAAEADDAGLLVVGSTSRGTLGRVLPGSTAERLMHGAPCPIAVIPHRWRAGGGLRTKRSFAPPSTLTCVCAARAATVRCAPSCLAAYPGVWRRRPTAP